MTAAIVVLSLALLAAIGGLIGLALKIPSLSAKALANGEALLQERAAKLEAVAERDTAVARETFEEARADDAVDQLKRTQALYAAASNRLVELRKAEVFGMTTEEALAAVNAEIARLSEAPGTALEVP